MKNKHNNLFLLLAFLPLALIPFSVPLAVLLTTLLLLYGFHFQSDDAFKKALNPLLFAALISTFIALTQILLNLFGFFAQLFPTVFFARLLLFVTTVYRVLNIVLLIVLIIGTIFAFLAVISNKTMPFLHKLISKLENNKNKEDIINTEKNDNNKNNKSNQDEIIIDED